jgi:cell pole-organizing protein PopZ
MDPITTAIVAALPALATDMVSGAVKDTYAGLKSLITHKFGATSAVAKSVEDLEANPKSQGQAMVLSEQVGEAKATSDTDIMAAVSKLVEALAKDKAAGTSSVIHATMSGGVAGIVGAQNASIGSMSVGSPEPNAKN